MEIIDGIVKIAGIVVPTVGAILTALFWFIKRIERGQAVLLKKINKIDKHKVSYKVCNQRRAEQLCTPQKGTK